jgi:hypothetical protein
MASGAEIQPMERDILLDRFSSSATPADASAPRPTLPRRGIPIKRRGGRSRVLAQIPGKYIVEAMSGLPACSEQAGPRHVEIDAGLFGRFRVTYRPYRHPRADWHRGWFWIAQSAERLDSPPTNMAESRGPQRPAPDPAR